MNYIDVMKNRKIPEDLRYEIYSHYLGEQVEQNHRSLMIQINDYIQDVKEHYGSSAWCEPHPNDFCAPGGPTTNCWRGESETSEEAKQNVFDYWINNAEVPPVPEYDEDYGCNIWWLRMAINQVHYKNIKKFMGFYNELGPMWWNYYSWLELEECGYPNEWAEPCDIVTCEDLKEDDIRRDYAILY